MARILIADDDDRFRGRVVDLFTRAGHAATSAADGREVSERIEEEPPDLMVLDFMMPYKDGFQVLAELRALRKFAQLPVIFVTAVYAEGPFYPHSWVTGPTYFASKPLSPVALVRLAECILRSTLDSPECLEALQSCRGALPE